MPFRTSLVLATILAASPLSGAGPHAPAAGKTGSTAVSKSDAAFAGWANAVVSYHVGADVEEDQGWMDTTKCLGAPGSDVYDITCLGNGGDITLSFAHPIADGSGWDFAVFENGFAAGFLELAYVEVSSDGVNWVRFPNHSATPSKVGAFANTMDATNLDGLASKYMLGYGTPFDLATLSSFEGADKLDLNAITQVRLVDIVGDGSCKDSGGNPIYDPTPTVGSGGFDLDAVGVSHFQTADALWSAAHAWSECWYGRVYAFSRYDGWIFSVDNGAYQYAVASARGVWIYDTELGWYYTAESCHPYIYFSKLNAWAYYYGIGADSVRWYCLLDDSLEGRFSLYPYATAGEIAAP